MHRLLSACSFAAVATACSAAPLLPEIVGHDWNFGAFNAPGSAEWDTFGAGADVLTYELLPIHTEVTAYWPTWPIPPVFPVFNPAGGFGGDFGLSVLFDGTDAPYVNGSGDVLDVSLTGTGAMAGADLVIFGAVPALGLGPGPLWAIDLDAVSLYGRSTGTTYVLEGIGTIVGGTAAELFHLIGRPGGMRGHIDLETALPSLYDPLVEYPALPDRFRAAYSGETGVVPEPATLAALTVGLASMLARRRNR